jgi:LysM repeat protein
MDVAQAAAKKTRFANRSGRVLLVLFSGLVLTTAGCFRPMGEAIQPTSSPENGAIPVTLESISPLSPAESTEEAVLPPDDSAAGADSGVTTPTLLPITILAPDTATPVEEPEDSSPPITTAPLDGATSNAPGVNITRTFITPGGPPAPVQTDTPMPTLNLPATATPSGLITPTALAGTTIGDCVYLVQAGDNLYRIALDNGFSLEEVRAANPNLVGDAPILQVGQTINLPCEEDAEPTLQSGSAGLGDSIIAPQTTVPTSAPAGSAAGGTTYIVRPGDTLYTIAIRNDTTVQALINANNLTNPNRLDVGQELIIPAGD